VKLYYAGRFFQGIAGGFWTISFQVYMVESASRQTRGAMSSGFQIGLSAGVLMIYLFGLVLETRGLALVSMIPVATMVVGILFMPDSPRWLLRTNRTLGAISALIWLRESSSHAVEEEFREIKRNIELHDTSLQISPACLREEIPRIWRPFTIGLSLIIFQQLTGMNVIVFNATEIFTVAGFSATGPFGAQTQALIFAAAKLVTLIPTVFLIDKYGRRPLFFFGAFIMGISCLVLGFFFAMDDILKDHHGWLAVVSLTVYISAFDIGMGSIPWLVMAEIMPIRVRGVSTGIASIICVTAGFLLAKEYQHIVDAISMDGMFWVFGAISFLAAIFACAVMPETKNKSLERIEDNFYSHTENSEFMKEIFGESD
jgi:MFS family permease